MTTTKAGWTIVCTALYESKSRYALYPKPTRAQATKLNPERLDMNTAHSASDSLVR